jgi:glycosyltransferase involved in cell wall biosynthesis
VLEALASGLPIVLTDVPGNRDFLDINLSHAWSGPAADPQGLAVAISQWLNDISNSRPNNHRQIAHQKFSFDACFGKIVSLYQSSLKSGSNGSLKH